MNIKYPKIILLALVLVLVLGCLLYFVHRSTPFDLTLNATKLDSDGNEIGTTQITIRGNRLDYLFQKDRVEIEVDPFDKWSSFMQIKESSTGKVGKIFPITDNLMYITFHAVEGDEISPCILYFTIDFDHFVLYIDTDEGRNTYLASVSDDHTADKVLDHFRSLRFDPLPPK